jgi:uncharacterized protein YndB with AHSA1/START domain
MNKRIDSAARLIRADAARIFEAFASPTAVESWLPPKGMTGAVRAFAFHEGGGYRIRLTYGEGDHLHGKTSESADEVEVEFRRLVPDQLIEQVVTFDSERPEFAGSMKMTWSFAEADEGTRVTVRCENVPIGIGEDDHQAGLTSTLENLAKFTERTAET